MPIRSWTDLTTSVRVCHSALYATASTVIHRQTPTGDTEALLVDPAWAPSELQGLAMDLAEAKIGVIGGFATHAHHDHLLWHPDLPAAPRYASPAAADLATRERAALITALGEGWPADLVDLMGRVRPTDDEIPGWPEIELITHDAHSTGHTALWFGAEKVLLAGDMLSDVELPLAQETGIAAYDAGLDALRPYVEQAAILVPGHGSPTADPLQRWLADRRYLDAIIAGDDPDDPRRGNPDMPEAHAANLAGAR